MNIPISRTVFTEADQANVLKPLQSGWVTEGPFVQEMESKWSAFTGAPHSIAVSSCTTGLHLSLAALGIGPGDEVLIPAFTWVATANVVESLGARPVFCDIDVKTFNVTTETLTERITERTRAVIPVHLFGLAADIAPILELARKHDLVVIEDAACGFGARYEGRHVGRFGETGCFSFHPRKAITTGEGGMITTEDAKLADLLRSMRDHGASISDRRRHLGPRPYLMSEFHNLGYNYRMTDIQASVGCTQMDRAQEIHESRRAWAARYDEGLSAFDWLQLPCKAPRSIHGFQAYVCLFEPNGLDVRQAAAVNERRNGLMDFLQQKGISTRPGTHAVHMLHYYADKYAIRAEDYPGAYIADQCSLAFPLFPSLTDEEFAYIIAALGAFSVARPTTRAASRILPG